MPAHPRRAIALLALLLFSLPALAQPAPKHVKLSAELNRSALQPGMNALVAVVVDIEKGYHAQSHTPNDKFLIPLVVTPADATGVTYGTIAYPTGKDEHYEALGPVPVNVYTGQAVVYVPVKVAADAKPGDLTIAGEVQLQICDDQQCFQKQKVKWSLATKVVGADEKVGFNKAELFQDYRSAGDGSGGNTPTTPAGGGNGGASGPGAININPDGGTASNGVLWALGTAFVAGILFNVVPCVLPVLPIKVLGFAEVAQHNRSKTIGLASVFGLGIVAVFGALAVFILLLKQFTWGQQFSNPYFAWGVVILLAIMAAWMFGWFNFNLPGGVYSFSPRHDTYLGNFEWGVLTAILSTPCTGPLFPPLMLWAQSQPLAVGIPAVMTVGVGMAAPYIFLSAFPGLARKFPRVGPWADLFKHMMGFLLLGAAVFFAAGRFLHGATLYWALVPVAAVATLYLLTKTVRYGARGRGIAIAAVLGVLMLGGTITFAATFVSPVNWVTYSDDAVAKARADGKIVLVKFTANWCLNCQYIERTVFHSKEAAAALDRRGVVCVKADLTEDDAPGWGRLKQLSTTGGIPLTAIYLPGRDQPIVITSVYTTGTLIETLDKYAPASGPLAAR